MIIFDKLEQCYLTPRYALQTLGTEWGQDCFKNTWVDLTIRDAERVLDPERNYRYLRTRGVYRLPDEKFYPEKGDRRTKGVVISDVRWPEGHEGQGIRKANGFVVKVARPGAGLKGQASQHASEAIVAKTSDEAYDHVLDNSGTLEELPDRVKDLLKELHFSV